MAKVKQQPIAASIKHVAKLYLDSRKLDGLRDPSSDCFCTLARLMHCGAPKIDCKPYKATQMTIEQVEQNEKRRIEIIESTLRSGKRGMWS